MLDIGEPGWLPGQFDGVHQVTEVHGDRSQEFVPVPDADPATRIPSAVGARTHW
jgi:hypothetical protein